MGWPRRSQDDREPETLRAVGPREERHPLPQERPLHPRERTDSSYWAWLALGVVSPYLLSALLYPLAWWPVWAVVLPLLGAMWTVLRVVLGLLGAAPASPVSAPPSGLGGGPMPWDVGPVLTPQAALTWVIAFAVAWFVLSRVAGRRRTLADENPARRGFRAGLRSTLLISFLLLVWWANRTLAGR